MTIIFIPFLTTENDNTVESTKTTEGVGSEVFAIGARTWILARIPAGNPGSKSWLGILVRILTQNQGLILGMLARNASNLLISLIFFKLETLHCEFFLLNSVL